MRILLLRHGMTPGNAAHRYIGRTDEPLSPEGAAAVRSAGGSDRVRRVYVTPLLRTRQTASLLFPRAAQTVVAGLREMDFGDFEGRSPEEMEEDAAYRAWVEGNCLAPCPHGEGMAAFTRRVCAAFEETLLAHEEGDSAVFVVHGGSIMAVLERYTRPPMGFYDCLTKNCQGFLCSLAPGEAPLPFLLTEVRRVERVTEALLP